MVTLTKDILADSLANGDVDIMLTESETNGMLDVVLENVFNYFPTEVTKEKEDLFGAFYWVVKDKPLGSSDDLDLCFSTFVIVPVRGIGNIQTIFIGVEGSEDVTHPVTFTVVICLKYEEV